MLLKLLIEFNVWLRKMLSHQLLTICEAGFEFVELLIQLGLEALLILVEPLLVGLFVQMLLGGVKSCVDNACDRDYERLLN